MLVVGAGPIAARKVDGLVAAGAAVRVVAPDVSPSARPRRSSPSCVERPYEPGDLDGVRLVVTATGDADVDAAVAADATAAGHLGQRRRPARRLLVHPPGHRPQRPAGVAVSTGGTSPALARRLRDHAGALLTDDVVALAVDLAARRAAVRAAGGSTEDVDWSGLHRPRPAAAPLTSPPTRVPAASEYGMRARPACRTRTARGTRVGQPLRMAAEPRQPRATFDTVADVYHRLRPGYPPDLFDDLFAMLP